MIQPKPMINLYMTSEHKYKSTSKRGADEKKRVSDSIVDLGGIDACVDDYNRLSEQNLTALLT